MKKQRRLVGIVMSEAQHNFYRHALKYLEEELLKMDADIAVFSTLCKSGMQEDYAEAECAVYEIMNLDLLDGIVVFPGSFSLLKEQNRLMEHLKETYHKPIICLESDQWGFKSEPFYDGDGLLLMMEHLVNVHGAKRVAFVSGHEQNPPAYQVELEKLFFQAADTVGLQRENCELYYGKFWISESEKISNQLISNANGLPDAVICCSNETAAGIIEELSKRGIEVPRDLIVTGYDADVDDETYASLMTSIYRNPEKMARNAARLLMNEILGKNVYEMVERNHNCILMHGSTCGCNKYSLGGIAHKMVTELIDSYERFPSEYNFMSEDVTKADTLEECLQNVDYYSKFLGKYEEMYLCLNERTLHSKKIQTHLTNKMYIVMQHVGNDIKINTEEAFPLYKMIPSLFMPSDQPRVFYFVSLHFVGRLMGYLAFSYGNKPQVYDRFLLGWMRKLANSLETQRRRLIFEDAVEETQVRDLMTGLYNYKGYLNALNEQYRHFSDKKRVFHVLAIDVERLSEINEQYGREEGNEVLMLIAKVLQGNIGANEVCARFGNDEFVVAGFFEKKKETEDLLEILRQKLQEYNKSSDKKYRIDMFGGRVAEEIHEKEDIVRLTSEALYRKKTLKENRRKCACREEEDATEKEERNVVMRLLNDNLLTYQFQPIVSAKTGAIYSYEALMRSGHTHKISPLVILKHAEAMNRLYDVEKLTFTNLLRFVKEHENVLQDKKLFINSIPKTILEDEDFQYLTDYYAPMFQHMVVEFTEQTEATALQIEKIHERSKKYHFEIAIDDYGTGYSNMTFLLNEMPNYVKIDRSLITGIDTDNKKQYFVSNVVEFAHDNGFQALAEGVETAEELSTVIQLGMDLIQGYYLAKPQDTLIEELEEEQIKEILMINSGASSRRKKKTYVAGGEDEILLTPMLTEGYTELVVQQENACIIGNPKMFVDIVLRIPDNTSCVITLRKVMLSSFQGRPCIEIGNNCDVTLVIDEMVQIKERGIRVPESSSLRIEGDGNLLILAEGDRAYAIGGDATQITGSITVALKGRLQIEMQGRECIGIGAGYAGKNRELSLIGTTVHLSAHAKQAIGMGIGFNAAQIVIRDSVIEMENHSDIGIGIGSLLGDSHVQLENVTFHNNVSGDLQVGVGGAHGKKNVVQIRKSEINQIMRAKNCVGFGCVDYAADVTMLNSKVVMHCEGADVTIIGTPEHRGRGKFENCEICVQASSANKQVFGYDQETMSFMKCVVTEKPQP